MTESLLLGLGASAVVTARQQLMCDKSFDRAPAAPAQASAFVVTALVSHDYLVVYERLWLEQLVPLYLILAVWTVFADVVGASILYVASVRKHASEWPGATSIPREQPGRSQGGVG